MHIEVISSKAEFREAIDSSLVLVYDELLTRGSTFHFKNVNQKRRH